MSNKQRTTERNESTLKDVVNTITPFLLFTTLVLFVEPAWFSSTYKLMLCFSVILSTVLSTVHAARFAHITIGSRQLKRAKGNALLCLIVNNVLLILQVFLLLIEYD